MQTVCHRKVGVVPHEKMGAKKLGMFCFSTTLILNGEYLLNEM